MKTFKVHYKKRDTGETGEYIIRNCDNRSMAYDLFYDNFDAYVYYVTKCVKID